MSKWDKQKSEVKTDSVDEVVTVSQVVDSMTKLELFTALAFHALIPTNMSRSALPNMAVDYAKSMLERLERE